MAPKFAAAVMVVAGIVGFVGACLPYYKYVYEDSYSAEYNMTVSVAGWLTPYSAIAALWLISAVGVAILDSGLLPQPKGAADAPYKKYTLMGAFGGAMVLAFVSSRLVPSLKSQQFTTDNPNPLDSIQLGPGFWMVIASAAVGFIAAVAAYIIWANKDNPKPQPAPAAVMTMPQAAMTTPQAAVVMPGVAAWDVPPPAPPAA